VPIRAVSRAGLTDWDISQPIAPLKINRDLSPHAQDIGEIEWQRVTADRSGLVDVARFLDHQPQLPQCVLARTTITVEQSERRKLLFGYSDEISVFLDGELLFRGDSAFRVRDSEFMGVVGLNDAVVLDLKKGKNELLFVVTESFGGWGFIARTESLRTDPVLLANGVTKSWELGDGLVMPESAVWDPKRGQLYVSNINPAGAAGFGEQGFISRIDAAGQVLEMQWITGLRGPTGVAVLDDRLYAVERTGVAVIDLETAKIASIVDLRPFGGDGITSDGAGAFLVSDFNGLLLRVTPRGDRDVLIDTRDVGISLTDFAFAPEHALVVVPTLRGNSLMAFKLDRTQ
jgi:DNA-binding beta-propeller fold protein YncE